MSTPQSHPSSQFQYGNPNPQPMGYPPQYPMANQGGPGPSTMQQMQLQQMMQGQGQGQGQMPGQSQGLTPQQIAALQQMHRSGMGQGQGQGLSQQHMQMAMAQLQQAGNTPQAQAMLQAMRNSQFQQQQQQQQQARPMPSGPPPPQLQQQQRLPPQYMQQGTLPPDVARIQMQQQMGRQGSPSNNHSSPRQPSNGNGTTPGSMPPPPLPSVQPAPPTPQQPPPQQSTRFTPTPTQIQAVAAQQQQFSSDPNFRAQPHAQQQIQLNMIHTRMMSMFASQHMQQQQPPPSPSPTQTQPGQSPYSSLPSHMAPPRPGSAASQRAPSPRQSTPQSPRNISTPPPNNQFQTGPSPSGSAQSPQQNGWQPPPPPEPTPPINTADFPFDPRLLMHMQSYKDPKWRTEMQTRNPGLLAAVHQANLQLQSGIKQETIERMQQAAMVAMRQLHAAQARPPVQESPRPAVAPLAEMPRRMSTTTAPSPAASMPPPSWIPGPTPAPLPPQPLPTTTTPSRHPSQNIPVPEWEKTLRPSIGFTSITPLPSDPVAPGLPAPSDFDPTFSGAIPPLSTEDIGDIRHWLDLDLAYLGNFDNRKKKVQSKMMNWAKESDKGTPWWMLRMGEKQSVPQGRGLRILWPDEKERERERVRSRALNRQRREIRFTPKQLKAMANVEDHVIPVRLDIEDGIHKLKDTFMWNCSDTVVSPELFAQSLCDDFNLPTHIFAPKIMAAINDRVKEYRDQVLPCEPKPESSGGKLEVDGEEWKLWKTFRDDILREEDSDGDEEVRTDEGGRIDLGVQVVVDGEEDVKPEIEVGSKLKEDIPLTVEEAMEGLIGEGMDDLRILIKVDIIIGTQNLSDTFEWDLSSPVSPEEFALMYTQELGLNGEFATALAHDIHEQILVHKRCLFLVGHTPGSGFVADDEVRSSFLPPLTSVLRPENIAMSTYTPIFTTYTEEDVLLIEREREKDSKRKKRGTRARRGVLLPDREPVKTHRTLLNPLSSNGSLPPKYEDLTPTLQHTGPHSRRAAAIAAQANINLIAQDLPIPEKAPPSPAPIFTSKRGRGLKGRGALRASPAGGREGSHLHDSNGTPTSTTIQIPVLPNLKRPHEDTAEDSPMQRKRSHPNHSPDHHQGDDVKPIIIPSLPHPTISRSRLNGSVHSGSRSGDSKSRSPEKGRGSTPKNSRRRLQDDDDDDDDDSDSDTSDSSEEEYGSRGRKGSKSNKKKSRGSTSTTRRPSVPAPTALPQVPPPPPYTATVTAQPAMPPRPDWFERADRETKSRYPKDKFMVVPKGKPEPGKEVEWRLRCVDCPGKIYNLGPGESYTNFEVHLKNRAHITNREKREAGV